MVFINNREQQLFHTVTFYNSSSKPTSADEPLLSAYDHHVEDEDEIHDDDGYANDYNIIRPNQDNESIIFRRYKVAALVIGLLVGIGIQFATLWANIFFSGKLSSSSQQQQNVVVLFSLIWSFFTSVMAVIILACLRNFVQKYYFSTLSKTTDEIIQEMMLQLEVRFVVAALIGVCMAWSITDALMGMPKQIILSLIILVVALAWCRIIMSFLVVDNNNNNNTKTPSSSYRYPACRHTNTREYLTPTSEILIV